MMASICTTDNVLNEDVFITERDPDLPNEEIDHVDTGITESKSRYKMDNKYRGIALIINNEVFEKGGKGSAKDMKCMQVALGELKFEVITHENQSVEQMKRLFEYYRKVDHTENDCFVAVILTHGSDKDIIYGTDNRKVTLTDLIEYLLPDKCPSLIGKPKLFFVQACRGKKYDRGVEVRDCIGPPKKIPLWIDVLIHHSTVPGFYAWRSEDEGSWFIQCLGDVLKNYGKKMELTHLLTMVNSKVAKEYESRDKNRNKQMPIFSSSLTRQLYFT